MRSRKIVVVRKKRVQSVRVVGSEHALFVIVIFRDSRNNRSATSTLSSGINIVSICVLRDTVISTRVFVSRRTELLKCKANIRARQRSRRSQIVCLVSTGLVLPRPLWRGPLSRKNIRNVAFNIRRPIETVVNGMRCNDKKERHERGNEQLVHEG